MKKILLIEVWLGELPDYYWHHQKTMVNQHKNIDVYFITDQEIDKAFESDNYKIIKISEEFILNRFYEKTQLRYTLPKNKTYLPFAALFLYDFFHEYINYSKYDYVGRYDIDTLFGDIYKWVEPFLGNKDIISAGGGKHHDRVSGPFVILNNKNTEIKDFFYSKQNCEKYIDNYLNIFEHDLDFLGKKNQIIKIIQNATNVDHETSKILYESTYSGGEVTCNDKKIMYHHFYDKKNTIFDRIGNTIISRYRKTFQEDFYWVVYFTKSYEKNVLGLIESIKKYSNRKCIL